MNGSRGAVVALVVWLSGLAWRGADLSGASAQDKQPPANDQERKELAKQIGALIQQSAEHHRKGRPGDAVRSMEQCLSLLRQLYPPDRFPDGHSDLAGGLTVLGTLWQVRGQFAQAEPYYRQALAMRQKLYPTARYPDGHPVLAANLDNLGLLLSAQGEYGQAEPYLRQALAMKQKLYPKGRFPDGHPDLAKSLSSLGTLLQAQGEYGKAEPYYRQALEMLQKLYPTARYRNGHFDLAAVLNNVGGLLRARGQYGQAEPYYRQALEMFQKLFPPSRYPDGHPVLAKSLSSLGSLLNRQGEYGKAEAFYRQALAMRQKLYPPAHYPDGHPDLATSLVNLGALLQVRADSRQAVVYFRQALEMYQRLAASFADRAAEAQALNFLARQPQARDLFLAVTANLPNASAAEVYAVLWQGKAALARALERRQRLFHALTDADARRQLQELLDIRRELAQRVLRPDHAPEGRPQRLHKLAERREELERALATQLPQLQERPPTYLDLRERLPADAAFVDLFRHLHLPQGKEKARPHYTAFILRQGSKVVRLELGEAEPIEQALAAWRKDIANALDSKAAAALRERLWDKLAPHLPAQPDSTVYLCPDGDLSALPWPALPGRQKGTILLEDHALALVPHGHALLDQLRPRAKDRPPAALLALGGARFDKAPDQARRPDDLAAVRPAQRSQGDGVWPELPGTAREAAAVTVLAKGLPKPPMILERTGSAASATQLYLDLPQVRWAHVATHGFFAAPETKERKYLFEEKEFLLGVQGFSGRERLGAGARHPLTQTGLVLAGANLKGKDAPPDGGILTAEAIAGLDLSKLELAVLSACETGLGEGMNGEGVFGLQRAFHLGGCRNVVASLWKVDDDATAALMALFYHHLWVHERPPLEALRQAQLALYRHPGEARTLARGRGPDFDKAVRRVTQPPRAGERPQRTAPTRDWAAFMLSGSGR